MTDAFGVLVDRIRDETCCAYADAHRAVAAILADPVGVLVALANQLVVCKNCEWVDPDSCLVCGGNTAPLAILNAHVAEFSYPEWRCSCGWRKVYATSTFAEQHRRHLAQLLAGGVV